MTANEPIDEIHRQSIEARRAIRRDVNNARKRLGIPERTYR